MKKVFTSKSELAHVWANELQDSATNSGKNFFFERGVIYSYGYHFPIAKHVKNEGGESCVLFTERTYSNTTAKHLSIVRQAVNHKNVIYCFNPSSTHDENFKSWQIECENIAANLPKAKKPEKYLSQIERVKGKVEEYAAFFVLVIPQTLRAALSIGDKEEFAKYISLKEEFAAQEKARHEKEMQKRHKKELTDWLKGKTNRLYVRDGFDYLRVNGDKVETSQGVEMDIEYAVFIYRRLEAGRLKVGDKVLDYNVLKMNGEVKIGCHNFKKSYLLSFGKTIIQAVAN